MIGLILYFLIGYIVGLAFYAYSCRDYKKHNQYLTWDQYNDKYGITFALFIVILAWPIVVIMLVAVFPAEYIRKYFGIE